MNLNDCHKGDIRSPFFNHSREQILDENIFAENLLSYNQLCNKTINSKRLLIRLNYFIIAFSIFCLMSHTSIESFVLLESLVFKQIDDYGNDNLLLTLLMIMGFTHVAISMASVFGSFKLTDRASLIIYFESSVVATALFIRFICYLIIASLSNELELLVKPAGGIFMQLIIAGVSIAFQFALIIFVFVHFRKYLMNRRDFEEIQEKMLDDSYDLCLDIANAIAV